MLEKISELRKQGMWSVRRLPKAAEPPHCKAHWDYVLEEMQWLANDFAQERKWKKAGARKVSICCTIINDVMNLSVRKSQLCKL